MPQLSPLSEDQFQAIFEQSPFGIVLFGSTGNILGANHSWSRIWDLSSDQFKGYNVLKDPPLISSDLQNAIRKAFQGEPQTLSPIYFNPGSVGTTGQSRYVQGYAFPIKNEAGEVCQVVGTLIDVTAQEEMKRELAASRDFLSVISRIAPTIIMVYDVTTGEYLHVSDAFEKMLGYPAEQVRREGVPFMLSIVHPEDAPRLMAEQQEALTAIAAQKPGEKANLIVPFEYRVRAFDGSWRFIRTLGSVLQRDEAGGVKTIVNASLDITELKAAIRFRDEFLAIASHELKTPLTPLKIQVGLLKAVLERGDLNAIPADVLRKMALIADQQIDRLTGLVNNLLDVSKITVGSLALKLEENDLGSFVRGVAEAYRSQAAESNCLLTIDASVGICLSFDSLRISQVIGNLVNNALIHAATPKIEIRVETHPESNCARITVRDEGKGIEKADLKRIFERFELSSTAQTVTGLGLGLFIAREIARAHGGEISVESHVGKGTAFTVELPLRKAEKEKANE